MNSKSSEPLHYLNNLKIFLTILVVMYHSAIVYAVGEVCFISSPQKTILLKGLIGICSAFFMGSFFLISAFFVPQSFNRYGLGLFILKKVKRLLAPAFFVLAVILPLTLIMFIPHKSFWDFYWHDWWSGKYFTFGQVWFVIQLFAYCLVYAAFRSIRSNKRRMQHISAPGYIALLTFAVILALSTMLVNVHWPIEHWAGFYLIEPYHLPQYIMLFVIGLLASNHHWFETFSARTGYIWLGIAVLLGSICAGMILLYSNNIVGYIWCSSFFCVAACFSLIILFREYFNKTTRLLKMLSANSYSIYLIHIPFVFLMDKWLLIWQAPALLKFTITFLFAYLISNIMIELTRIVILLSGLCCRVQKSSRP